MPSAFWDPLLQIISKFRVSKGFKSRERHNSEISLISKPLTSCHPLILISKWNFRYNNIFSLNLPGFPISSSQSWFSSGSLSIVLGHFTREPETIRRGGNVLYTDCMQYSYEMLWKVNERPMHCANNILTGSESQRPPIEEALLFTDYMHQLMQWCNNIMGVALGS